MHLENSSDDFGVGAVDGLDEQRLAVLIDRVEAGTGGQQHPHAVWPASPRRRVHRPVEVFLLYVGLLE